LCHSMMSLYAFFKIHSRRKFYTIFSNMTWLAAGNTSRTFSETKLRQYSKPTSRQGKTLAIVGQQSAPQSGSLLSLSLERSVMEKLTKSTRSNACVSCINKITETHYPYSCFFYWNTRDVVFSRKLLDVLASSFDRVSTYSLYQQP
jgi:hypothetical protein